MPKNTAFHGILAVGRTKADAINNYRLLAMSKGATLQVDSGKQIAFVTQASAADGMFNPLSGNMDLETDDSLMETLEFKSNSSGDVEVNHLVCKSGCEAHIIFDSENLVKFCPNCTSSLSEDDSEEEEESDEDSDDSEESAEGEGDDSDMDDESLDEEDSEEEDSDEEVSAEGDDSEEEESEEESDEGDSEESEEGDEESDEESDEDDKPKDEKSDEESNMPDYTEDDGQIVIAADSFAKAKALFKKHLPMTALSSDKAEIDAFYKVCSSSDCGAHVVGTSEVDECPACHSSLTEPEQEPGAEAKVETKAEEVEDKTEGENTVGDAATKVEVTASDKSQSMDDMDMEDEDAEDEGDTTLELTDEDSGNVLDEDTEELDGMDEVDETAESSALDVSYSSSVAGRAIWTAFYKGLPVAIASKADVGGNADMFDTPSFGHAALATAKVSGIRKALTELGFKSIKHKVSVSTAVRKMVDTQVAEARTSLSAEQKQFKERFMASLASAAIGLNRGFFADKKNPIKAAMWNALSSAGIRNPEALIDTAFKNHVDAYHKTLFELASDISSKPAEVQESLAKAIVGISYQEVSTASGETIEGRLETIGTSVSSDVKKDTQPTAAAVDRQQISNAVKSLGHRSR